MAPSPPITTIKSSGSARGGSGDIFVEELTRAQLLDVLAEMARERDEAIKDRTRLLNAYARLRRAAVTLGELELAAYITELCSS